MKVNIADIPSGKTVEDYPSDTIFVFSESLLPRHYGDEEATDENKADAKQQTVKNNKL